MKDVLCTKGFLGSVHYSEADDCFFGRIEGIDDLVTFEGRTTEELRAAFQEAVEDYLALCRKVNKPVLKSYRGGFNVRLPADLHMKAVRKSVLLGMSLNKLVQRAIENEVREERR